ncbi:MAG TPA: hypothetical protein VFE50_01915, partial [Cyclobacteriaceae bacterium]|nr:hypothetical protein [Cyclobacteriaceae bacterium]
AAANLQAKDIVWHQGAVVLSDNSVVVGDIARASFDLVLYRNSNANIQSFPAHKVSFFRYYDREEDINRIFVSVGRKYYERVVTGKITVFRIQQVFDQAIDESKPALFRYYVEQGKVVCSMKRFKAKYFEVVKKQLDEGLISYRHLDPNTRYGALSLIMLYNKSI